MSRPVAVLRPEPGNATTAARVEAAGLTAIRLPLFETRPLDWAVPDPSQFDALILTSANAARFAGAGLAQLATLPVYAVGEATAESARDNGLTVTHVGHSDGAALIAEAAARGVRRALLLAGRDRVLDTGGIVAATIAVYASDPRPMTNAAILNGAVALLHSARAARHLAALVDEAGLSRAAVHLVAISPAVLQAAGSGWGGGASAAAPVDAEMIAAAARLAD